MQERLMKRFAPQDYVRVTNIDDEPFRWQYLPAHEEEFEYTPDPMKITRRGQPEVWEVAPGATEVIVGANAYLMIEGLYKKCIAKTVLSTAPAKEGQARNFNYADGGQQEKYINLIYGGKATPTFDAPVASEPKGLEAPKDASKKSVGVAN
jgi:hypothetical protein